jgi:molybdopterin synthase catalytic subunit
VGRLLRLSPFEGLHLASSADPLLAACKDAIDTLKETVPLWKKEVYEGGEEWIGRGS